MKNENMSERTPLPEPIPYTRNQENIAIHGAALLIVEEYCSPELYAEFRHQAAMIVGELCLKENFHIGPDFTKGRIALTLIQPMIYPSPDGEITGCLFAVYLRSEEDPEDCTLFDQLFLKQDPETKDFISIIRQVTDYFPLTRIK